MHSGLADLGAAEAARLVRMHSVSPLELVDSAIARLTARNPALNAFVFTDFDRARDRARRIGEAVMRGGGQGILAGVPTAMKDLFDSRPGWPTTFGGVPALRHTMPRHTTAYPARIESEGAVLLGKTNSPVFGFRGTCDNPLFGPTRNPFDLARNSGGSSGGSAAAVAAGMVAVAGATDAGGSIRIPAAWCGVYGFQPSFGRVPVMVRPNAFAGTGPFQYEGPVSRSVEDAALVMQAIAGHDPRDPFSLDAPVDYQGALRRGVGGMKIGYTPDFGTFPVDPRIRQTLEEALAAFAGAGVQVIRVHPKLPCSQREMSDLWCRIKSVGTLGVMENFKAQGIDLLTDHRDELPAAFLHWLDVARRMTPLQMGADQVMRTRICDAVMASMEGLDALACPTVCAMPVRNGDDGLTAGPTRIEGVEVDPLIGWCPTYLTNFSGQPSASLPAGMADGLPVGLLLIGRRLADTDVLALSAAFERARPWKAIYRGLDIAMGGDPSTPLSAFTPT